MDTLEMLNTLLPATAMLPGENGPVVAERAPTGEHDLLVWRTLHLFGPDPAGIAQRTRSGRAVCVDLARAILFDRARRAGLVVPSAWLTHLDALDEKLTAWAAMTQPELAQPNRSNPALAFALHIDGTPMGRVLGARCHLMLARKAHQLVRFGTVDLQESLRAQITPLKLAQGFPWEKLPPLEQLEHDRAGARDVRRDLFGFFSHLSNRKDPSRRLASNTVKDYWGVLVLTLDLPGTGTSGAWRRLVRADAAAVFRVLDDDPLEEEDDTFSAARYQAATERERESLDDDSGEEDERDLVAMSPAQRYARRDYAAQTAVLRQFVTTLDTQTVPMRQVALGYAALLGTYTPATAPYAVLAPLALYHLCLTTGRDIDTFLDLRVEPMHNQALSQPLPHPVFDPTRGTAWATPTVYPQLPKALREAPDKKADPEDHAAWQRALAQHHRLYHRTTPAHELVLDGFGRWCLQHLYGQRIFLPGERDKDAGALFVNARGEPLSRDEARTLVTQRVTAAARRVMPDAPAITFARLRHTFWSHAVAGAGIHPMLAQLEAGRARPELYSHSFYVCVSPAPLRERIGAAQTHLMAHVCKAHAEAMQGWAKALGHVIQPLVLPAQSAKDEKTLKQPDDVDELRLGSTYCVRRSVLRRLLWAAFTEMAGIDARHAEVDERRRAWADAQTYLCVLLAGICLGTRVSEVAQLRATAVDLQYTPPLLTLLGKGNRFAEESRTLMIPSRLVPLWRAVVPAGAPTPHTPAFTLHKQGRDDGRPLKREDVWRHVMASSARAGLRGDASDGVIRFHALRHHLVSFFLAQGVGWAHDAYWTGHQTAGAELLHPATPGALQAMWAEIAPALDTLLDELGITEAIVAAVVTRDGPVLAALANALKPTDLKIDDEAEVNDGDVAGPYETDTSVGAPSRRSSTHGRGIPNTRTVNHSDTHNDDILSDEAGGATAALADPTPSESVR